MEVAAESLSRKLTHARCWAAGGVLEGLLGLYILLSSTTRPAFTKASPMTRSSEGGAAGEPMKGCNCKQGAAKGSETRKLTKTGLEAASPLDGKRRSSGLSSYPH